MSNAIANLSLKGFLKQKKLRKASFKRRRKRISQNFNLKKNKIKKIKLFQVYSFNLEPTFSIIAITLTNTNATSMLS